MDRCALNNFIYSNNANELSLTGLGALLPTVGTYLRSKGIGADEAALLGFVAPLLGFFVRSLVPAAADRFGGHRIVRCPLGVD